MSNTAEALPAAIQAKELISHCKSRLLNTFSFVPDDKLNWSPTPTGRSALRLVAHCGVANGGMLLMISGQEMPFASIQEAVAAGEAAEIAVTTRELAIELVEESTAKILAAIDELTQEQLDSTVQTPFFTAPMTFCMRLPGRHMDNHASQIDYVQTCWGDMDWHM